MCAFGLYWHWRCVVAYVSERATSLFVRLVSVVRVESGFPGSSISGVVAVPELSKLTLVTPQTLNLI